MRCSKCGSDNPAGKKFCEDCGGPLANPCPKCGAQTTAGKRFCGECGAPLDATAGIIEPRDDGGLAAERRHLTVLFCDLVGSTEIAAQLDPEEWRELVAGYHRAAAEAITRYGGTVAKYLGDGVMAYFGWPAAHENDAERAARAGLAILESVSELNLVSRNPKISVRVGIDSGAVVVGRGAGKDADVFGEAPNIAARVQSAAAANTVLITAGTHRLISGLFVVEQLGAQELKGVVPPVELYRVLRPTGVRSRLGMRGLTPFVGREEEIRLLLTRWERAREGESQVVLVIGEPGIGKSRLVTEFRDRLRDAPHIWMESAGEQFFENTPFHAIVEMLSQWLELQDAPNTDAQFQRVERALASGGLVVAEAAPLIAELLQLPTGERYPALSWTAEQKRRRLLAALSRWLLGAARLQPVAMVVEDLHWVDPSTLELLQMLAEQGGTAPVMLLYTARPEFRAPWPMRTHHSQIAINRLSARNVREMVARMASASALASESVEAVVERTGGVPLFVEELTRAVLENTSGARPGCEIPATLQDSLMARLDRLGSAKEVIQIGAVIGSEFSYELLHAVNPITDENLQRALHEAIDAELVYSRGIAPESSYQFKHALIRDAAYETLLRTRRKELHSRITQVLEQQFPNTATSAPELVAHHYTEAGLIERAIPYWQQAGQRAVRRSANLEAINHLNKGLELIKTLPNTPQRAEQELLMLNTLGTPVLATQGYGAPEVEKIYRRARKVCQEMGSNSHLFPALRGLWAYKIVRAEYQAAYRFGAEFLELAKRSGDSGQVVEAHFLLGFTQHFLGELLSARGHCEDGIELYDPQAHHHLAFSFGVDPGVNCLSCAPMVIWSLGYPEQAVQQSNQALALARTLNHPFSTAWALTAATWLWQFLGDHTSVEEYAHRTIAITTEHTFPFFAAWGRVWLGWALTMLGRETEGWPLIREAVQTIRATDAMNQGVTCFIALLGQAYAKMGDHVGALPLIDEALAQSDATGECFYRSELFRLKGDLFMLVEDFEAAENSFRSAIHIAQKQSAKSWELRATTGLARLLGRQGRREEARSMLLEAYGWFTEGFDTADLRNARTLLDELRV